jgi:Fe-S-cluster-containing hydrogenase component 2
VLAFFTVWTWQAASLVMRPYDPWVAYAHITSAELLTELGIGLAVLGVSLAGSLVYERFFCKYLCPTGALLGLFSKVSLLGIERDDNVCIDCGKCDKACPMSVGVSTLDTVTASECISCNECVNACPASGALEIKRAGGGATKPVVSTIIVVALLSTVVAASTAAGAFAWTVPSLAEVIEQQQGSTDAGGDDSAAPAPFDTSIIKGRTSMQEISESTGIPAEDFTARWGVPAEDLDKPMKDIKDQYDFEPDDVRVWVGEQMAQPQQ